MRVRVWHGARRTACLDWYCPWSKVFHTRGPLYYVHALPIEGMIMLLAVINWSLCALVK